ncbi:hypothetical protein [Botrimarina sp.]|uniref:hypothetical protein n=1 Tax=Botrimarina sp. TaxID=2795802 RepID=UPI0032EEA0C8
MDPKQLFADQRHAAFCVFCGDAPTTREHAASKVLLDDPLPDDLPVVFSCSECNNGFAIDEEYLACLLDCVISGTTVPDKVGRKKVADSLRHSSGLAARIAASCKTNESGRLIWEPEAERVRNVVVKLARGHVAHQYSEPQLDDPTNVFIAPFEVLTDEQREHFETPPDSSGWPEIGSRAFINLIVGGDKVYDIESGWSILQRDRYRYLVAQPGEIVVRIVLSEYLACEIVW